MKRFLETRHSTLIGLAGGALVLVLTAAVSDPHPAGLFNLPGLLTVLGGTLAATVVSRPARDVLRVLKSLGGLMRDAPVDMDTEMSQLLEVAHWYRAGHVRVAEQAVDRVANPFLRTGARLVVDCEPLDDVTKVLQWRVAALRTRERGDIQILRTMAMFAPAFGMLGTLFGLVEMLGNLGHTGLSALGTTMSFALITTLYGIVLANAVLKPLAIKMEQRARHRILIMNVLLEGIVLLYQRRHPAMIREAMTAYMRQHQDMPEGSGDLLPVA